jgi:hypothetical protein
MIRYGLDGNTSSSQLPLRETEYIIKYKKEDYCQSYLVRWRRSILSGEMLNTIVGEDALLADAWKIRPHWAEDAFASPHEIDEACLYDVIWYDSWVPSWMVQNANLLNEFWTARYQNRKR